MTPESMSNVISSCEDEISLEIFRDECCMLPPKQMAKRETIGKRLKRARDEAGLQIKDIVRKSGIPETTLRDGEKDKNPNPGIKTIESFALAYGLDPLELISVALDDPPEQQPGFKASQFAQLYERYKTLNKEQKAFIDDYIVTLIQKVEGWLKRPDR